MSEAANTGLRPSPIARVLRVLRPGHTHTATTATLLLMISAFLSRIIGLVREKFTAYLFGAGGQMDAYRAAFQLPDTIAYFLVGGAASITFITILNRYYERGEEAEGERVMSVIISVMLVVLGAALVVAELLAGAFVRWYFAGYSPEKAALATHMTRILLPAQLMFFIGGVLSAVLLVRKQFAYQALSPLIYAFGIIVRRPAAASLARSLLAGRGRHRGRIRRTLPAERHWRPSRRHPFSLRSGLGRCGLARVGAAFHSADAGALAGHRGRMDHRLADLA